VPASVVARFVRVDLEPFGYAAAAARTVGSAPDARRVARVAHKWGVGVEDARVFDGPAGPLCLHYDYDASRARVRPHLSEIAPGGDLAATRALEPPGGARACEKNWGPWVYGGAVHFSYTLAPHVVLRLDAGGALVEAARTGAAGALRGSTNFLRCAAGYVGAAHERRGAAYAHRWVLFRREPPFAVTAVSAPFRFLRGARGAEFATTSVAGVLPLFFAARARAAGSSASTRGASRGSGERRRGPCS